MGMKWSVRAACVPLLVVLCVFRAEAQLDPPVGPITSTFKTLTEVEPRIAINATNTPGDADSIYIISQPGSYYMTGNIKANLFSTKTWESRSPRTMSPST